MSFFDRRKLHRRQAPRARRFEPTKTGDEKVDRVVAELADELNVSLAGALRDAAALTLNALAGGVNLTVKHGLGRAPRGAVYAGANRWGPDDYWFHRQADNPQPELELWLHVAVAEPTELTLLVF